MSFFSAKPPSRVSAAAALVADNIEIGLGTVALEIQDDDLPQPLPALGRFARLRAWVGPPYEGGPLLDRPISIFRSSEGKATFLIRTVGDGTWILSFLKKGEMIKIMAPLGRGLDEACPGYLDTPWYLAAGGIGLGAMGSIADALGGDAILFYGEREGKSLMDLAALFPETKAVIATEDGLGRKIKQARRMDRPKDSPLLRQKPARPHDRAIAKGLVTIPLANALAKEPRPIFACGPRPMLAAVTELALSFGVPVFASIEARMACGLGACLSCAVPLKGGGSVRACREGPVVNAASIDWERFQ